MTVSPAASDAEAVAGLVKLVGDLVRDGRGAFVQDCVARLCTRPHEHTCR